MLEAGSKADRRANGSELVRESERASGSELVRESERARGGERARESERARGGGLAADSRLAAGSRARARGAGGGRAWEGALRVSASLSLAAAAAAAALWGTAARESANADAPRLTECPRSAGAGQNEAEAACKRAREHPRARRRAERLLARVGLRASRAAVGERARQGAAARGGGERPLREMAGERVR